MRKGYRSFKQQEEFWRKLSPPTRRERLWARLRGKPVRKTPPIMGLPGSSNHDYLPSSHRDAMTQQFLERRQAQLDAEKENERQDKS